MHTSLLPSHDTVCTCTVYLGSVRLLSVSTGKLQPPSYLSVLLCMTQCVYTDIEGSNKQDTRYYCVKCKEFPVCSTTDQLVNARTASRYVQRTCTCMGIDQFL